MSLGYTERGLNSPVHRRPHQRPFGQGRLPRHYKWSRYLEPSSKSRSVNQLGSTTNWVILPTKWPTKRQPRRAKILLSTLKLRRREISQQTTTPHLRPRHTSLLRASPLSKDDALVGNTRRESTALGRYRAQLRTLDNSRRHRTRFTTILPWCPVGHQHQSTSHPRLARRPKLAHQQLSLVTPRAPR